MSEHCCRKEGARPQRLRAGVDEIVPYSRGQNKNAAGANRMSGAVFHLQLAAACDDILRLFGGIGVPAKTPSGFDFLDDRRRLSGPVSSVDHEGAVPAD